MDWHHSAFPRWNLKFTQSNDYSQFSLHFGIFNLHFGIFNLQFGILNSHFGILNIQFGIKIHFKNQIQFYHVFFKFVNFLINSLT